MAAGRTYTPIKTYTVADSAISSYTFTSIPNTYTDLVLVANLRGTNTNGNGYIRVGNGTIDTGTNYSSTLLGGDGTSVYANRDSNRSQVDNLYATKSDSASIKFATNIVHFMNYSNTTTYKTIIVRSNDADVQLGASVSTWRSTSAIDQIRVLTNANIEVGSWFILYGIAAA